jgi:hypothetical protein
LTGVISTASSTEISSFVASSFAGNVARAS